MGIDGDTLWFHTLGYGMTAPKLAYLTDEQNCRRERIRVARMIWRGHHRRAFLEEGRTQFDFPEIRVQEKVLRPYIKFNVSKLISNTVSDLLLGEEPMIKIGDDLGQAAADALKDRSDIHRVFYDATRTASWAGEALVECVRWQGDVYLQDVKPDEVFPLGDRQPDGQFAQYRRFATAKGGDGNLLLLETTYSPGLIERQCFKLAEGGSKGDEVQLSSWPVKRADGGDLLPKEDTGIAWNSMIWVANELDEGNPTSDYDGMIELQDELNAKQTQIARVIAKHSDPKLAMPEGQASANGGARSDHDLFFFRSKDEIPSYITWNAELAAAIEDRDFALSGFCIAAEMSQGLLGLEKGAAPDSARKLRLQATKSLLRAKRKASFIKPFIRTALMTGLMMERAGLVVKVAMGTGGGGPSVELRDGLPVDDQDQASAIATLRSSQAMSIERAVRLQIPDETAAKEEVELIKAEAAAAAPSVVMGPVGEGGGGGSGAGAEGGMEAAANKPPEGGIPAVGGGGA